MQRLRPISRLGVDGKTHTLNEYAGTKVLAFVFDCNHCSASHLYESRIHKLYDDYHDRGLTLIAVSPDNPASIHYDQLAYSDSNDSLIEIQDRATERHIVWPYLYDGAAQSLTGKLGAAAAPQIFVFDQGRKLRYEGRIDDNEMADKVTAQDARNAIDALLADKPVAVATTPVAGCPTIWNGKAAPDPAVAQVNAEQVNVTLTTPESLKKLRGNGTGKLLLVNLWATWCGPCVARNSGFAGYLPDVSQSQLCHDNGLRRRTGSAAGCVFVSEKESVHQRELSVRVRRYISAVQDSFDLKMSGAVPYTLACAQRRCIRSRRNQHGPAAQKYSRPSSRR